jgi:hypothetical protein
LDGSGAARPSPESLKDAREFIRSLAPESVFPRPALHADGNAVLLLRDADTYAEIEFLGGKKIGFYARRGRDEWADETSFGGASLLPSPMSQLGFAIYR